ncbi:MAG: hypothetical protein Kow0070_18660 [Anaerolineales bacterium]
MANDKKNPQRFGEYEILAPLGKGRFAEVFRARKRDLGREVALKILLPVWNDNPAVREQFQQQARLIARLRHPRIVKVFDLGEQEGRLYMAMEYLPRGDAGAWLQSLGKERPSLPQVATLIEDAAAALDFIHHQTGGNGPLAHGDVKPGNLLLSEDRETPGLLRVKLTDLGLLTALQQAATRSASAAYPQSSPFYISPEQASDQPPSPLSDQYSLAVVAYELLTGAPPFSGGSEVTLYRQHTKETPAPPSSRASGLTPEIDEVLLKALAKDPAARHLDCPTFARALRQAVETAGQKRLAALLDEARAALQNGQPEKALPALDEAARLKPEDAEVKRLLEQSEKAALAKRNYEEAAQLLQAARQEAQALRSEAPAAADPQKLLAALAPLPPSPLQRLWRRWQPSLLLAGALLALAFLFNLSYAAATTTRDPGFQTRVAPFWTASPTFTPTPYGVDAARAAQVALLYKLGGLQGCDRVRSVAFSPDGSLLAAGCEDGSLRLWNVATRQPLGEPLTGHSRDVNSVAFSPDGTLLASGSWDNTLRLWDVATRQPLGEPLTGHGGDVNSVAFSPDGTLLASGSEDETIRLWDVATRQPLGEPLRGHSDYVISVAFSPDGTLLASGSEDETIRLWDVATRQPLGEPLTGHSSNVRSVAFSPDGTLLASGSWDDTIRLWNVATRQPLGEPLTGHTDWVGSVAFSPDGTLLASGSDDATIRLWDVATRQPLGEPLTGHSFAVYSVAFSPEGWWLASVSYNEVFLWGVPRWDARRTPTPTP